MESTASKVKHVILGSGSSANSYLLIYNKKIYVIDNGFSCREFEKRIKQVGYRPQDIALIFITHTHGDHIKGVELLAKKYSIPVVAHKKIQLERYFKVLPKKLDIEPGRLYPFEGMEFKAFPTSHDSSYSLGFQFRFPGKIFTLITDTGKVSEEMFRCARESHVLFLEANYSKKMLSQGSYPYPLKKRISSNQGHLSNEDAAIFMEELSRSTQLSIEQIYLCHLSKNNNSPEQVVKELSEIYKGNIPWRVCRRGELVCTDETDLELLPQ